VGSVSPELLGVSAAPVSTGRWSCLGGSVTLGLKTSGLNTSGGEASHFSVSVLAGADPVDAGVTSDGLVVGVNEDDLVELEGGILTNPVRVEDTEVGAHATNAHLSDGLVGLFLLELADTVVDGLTENDTFTDVSLTATTSDTGAVDDETLGSLVTQSAGLIGTGRTAASVDGGELSELPSTDSEYETEEIGLLLFPQFFKIFERSHLTGFFFINNNHSTKFLNNQ